MLNDVNSIESSLTRIGRHSEWMWDVIISGNQLCTECFILSIISYKNLGDNFLLIEYDMTWAKVASSDSEPKKINNTLMVSPIMQSILALIRICKHILAIYISQIHRCLQFSETRSWYVVKSSSSILQTWTVIWILSMDSITFNDRVG